MVVRSDGEIQAAVFDELAWDSRVTATDIEVTVHQRIVTLTGTVQSYAERLAAEAAAHRLYGVRAVVNDIGVTVPGSGLPPHSPRLPAVDETSDARAVGPAAGDHSVK